ncbi:uncharacterized protein LOC122251444 [Penaeus japonicus]|uniref:uncharacterized protein LOC122251444 n=1 Tax=Penaeus japonicus TaxID=27405 RepID=UPI001C712CA5|nr:uncharacterized protein LOC122251444 [Penaeus japonicus]
MNALTVVSVAALVASSSAQLLAYNGVYGGHHGLLGTYPSAGYSGLVPYAYTGALPATAPLALKTSVIKSVAPAPVPYNVAPAPVSYNVAPAPVSYNVGPAPVSYNVAPYAPAAPIQSQYHAQDEIGQYSFGYAGGPSSRAESRDAFGVVRGSYNYVDSEGKVQTQHYVADALGFRVSGTNLPVAPDAPVAASLGALPGPLPQPVQDTPEVAAAKFAHQQAYNEAAAAAAAAPDTLPIQEIRTVISVAALVASGSTSLIAYNGVYGGHHGLLGANPYAGYSGLLPYAYTGALPAAAPLTLETPVIKSVAPAPVSYNVAPAPVSYNVAPYAPVSHNVASAPVSYNVAPAPVSYNVGPAPVSHNVAPYAPVAPIQSQYHAQDEIGQYSFGYAGGPSSRAESRDAFGVVRGSYNYVDSEGKVQTQHYVADALGFRVSGTNLPVAPDVPLAVSLGALPGPLPEPVQDTPEVAAAKFAHQQAYNEAAAAAAAAPDTRRLYPDPRLYVSTRDSNIERKESHAHFATFRDDGLDVRYSGLLPYAYTGALPTTAPLTLKTPVIKNMAPAPVSYNVAPAPVSYNMSPAPVSYKVAPAPVSYNVSPAPCVLQRRSRSRVLQSSSCTRVLQRSSRTCVLQRSSLRTCSPHPVPVSRTGRDQSESHSFGYAGGPSSRAESRDAFGVVRSSYSYVDSEGKVQTQHYVADALGFRVSGTNLPVAPDAPLAAPLAALPGPLPEPVQDTPEVAAAKFAHQQAYNEAAAAAAAAPDTR